MTENLTTPIPEVQTNPKPKTPTLMAEGKGLRLSLGCTIDPFRFLVARGDAIPQRLAPLGVGAGLEVGI